MGMEVAPPYLCHPCKAAHLSDLSGCIAGSATVLRHDSDSHLLQSNDAALCAMDDAGLGRTFIEIQRVRPVQTCSSCTLPIANANVASTCSGYEMKVTSS